MKTPMTAEELKAYIQMEQKRRQQFFHHFNVLYKMKDKVVRSFFKQYLFRALFVYMVVLTAIIGLMVHFNLPVWFIILAAIVGCAWAFYASLMHVFKSSLQHPQLNIYIQQKIMEHSEAT